MDEEGEDSDNGGQEEEEDEVSQEDVDRRVTQMLQNENRYIHMCSTSAQILQMLSRFMPGVPESARVIELESVTDDSEQPSPSSRSESSSRTSTPDCVIWAEPIMTCQLVPSWSSYSDDVRRLPPGVRAEDVKRSQQEAARGGTADARFNTIMPSKEGVTASKPNASSTSEETSPSSGPNIRASSKEVATSTPDVTVTSGDKGDGVKPSVTVTFKDDLVRATPTTPASTSSRNRLYSSPGNWSGCLPHSEKASAGRGTGSRVNSQNIGAGDGASVPTLGGYMSGTSTVTSLPGQLEKTTEPPQRRFPMNSTSLASRSDTTPSTNQAGQGYADLGIHSFGLTHQDFSDAMIKITSAAETIRQARLLLSSVDSIGQVNNNYNPDMPCGDDPGQDGEGEKPQNNNSTQNPSMGESGGNTDGAGSRNAAADGADLKPVSDGCGGDQADSQRNKPQRNVQDPGMARAVPKKQQNPKDDESYTAAEVSFMSPTGDLQTSLTDSGISQLTYDQTGPSLVPGLSIRNATETAPSLARRNSAVYNRSINASRTPWSLRTAQSNYQASRIARCPRLYGSLYSSSISNTPTTPTNRNQQITSLGSSPTKDQDVPPPIEAPDVISRGGHAGAGDLRLDVSIVNIPFKTNETKLKHIITMDEFKRAMEMVIRNLKKVGGWMSTERNAGPATKHETNTFTQSRVDILSIPPLIKKESEEANGGGAKVREGANNRVNDAGAGDGACETTAVEEFVIDQEDHLDEQSDEAPTFRVSESKVKEDTVHSELLVSAGSSCPRRIVVVPYNSITSDEEEISKTASLEPEPYSSSRNRESSLQSVTPPHEVHQTVSHSTQTFDRGSTASCVVQTSPTPNVETRAPGGTKSTSVSTCSGARSEENPHSVSSSAISIMEKGRDPQRPIFRLLAKYSQLACDKKDGRKSPRTASANSDNIKKSESCSYKECLTKERSGGASLAEARDKLGYSRTVLINEDHYPDNRDADDEECMLKEPCPKLTTETGDTPIEVCELTINGVLKAPGENQTFEQNIKISSQSLESQAHPLIGKGDMDEKKEELERYTLSPGQGESHRIVKNEDHIFSSDDIRTTSPRPPIDARAGREPHKGEDTDDMSVESISVKSVSMETSMCSMYKQLDKKQPFIRRRPPRTRIVYSPAQVTEDDESDADDIRTIDSEDTNIFRPAIPGTPACVHSKMIKNHEPDSRESEAVSSSKQVTKEPALILPAVSSSNTRVMPVVAEEETAAPEEPTEDVAETRLVPDEAKAKQITKDPDSSASSSVDDFGITRDGKMLPTPPSSPALIAPTVPLRPRRRRRPAVGLRRRLHQFFSRCLGS